MITLGGSEGCLFGVPGPNPPGERALIELNRSGDTMACGPVFNEFIEFIEFDCARGAGAK